MSGGSDLLYSLKNLGLAHLVSIATSRATIAGRTVPRIDVDANWLIRKYFSKNGSVLLGSIVEVIAAFVQAGFAVFILFDGDDRPHVKMAYFARRTEVEVARINGIKAKGAVMALSQRLATGQYKSGNEKVCLSNDLAREEKFLSSCESKANNAPPSDCYNLLKEAVKGITDVSGKGGSIAMVAKATFEADYAIAYRAKHGETDLILGNDTDYPGIVGDACLAVKMFKYNSRDKTITRIVLSSGCKDTITSAAYTIDLNLSDSNQFTAAKYPLLDGASPAMRAGIMVGLGCDTSHKNGIKGVGTKTIFDFIASMDSTSMPDHLPAPPESPEPPITTTGTDGNSRPRRNVNSIYQRSAPAPADTTNDRSADGIQTRSNPASTTTGDVRVDCLLNMYVQKDDLKRGKDVLWTCAQALLYQPGNIVDVHPPYPILYLHGPPSVVLCKYLDQFNSNPYETTEDCPVTATCRGNGISGRHLFLKGDGCYSCSSCGQLLCRQCVVDTNQRENKLREARKESKLPANRCCTDCYSTSVLAASGEANALSITAMKKKLEEKNQNGLDGLSNAEIMDLYDLIVVKDTTDFYSANICSKVKFPLRPATSLDDGTIKSLLRFDFQDGGRMIRSEVLTAAQRVQVTELLARMLVFDDEPPENLKLYANVLPKMVIEFAGGSRADDGYRLMQRCIRHAMDSKTEQIIKARGEVVEHNGEIGMRIQHQMQPSFKEGSYSADVVFTKSAIVACSCTCKAGADCKKCDKHVDVHILPVLFLLVLGLYDGLAEHFLVELAEAWNQLDDDIESADVMMESIDTLKRAIRGGNSGRYEPRSHNATVSKLLEDSLVGTERQKKSPAPPHPRSLCPLAAVRKFKSCIKAGEEAIRKRREQTSTSNDGDTSSSACAGADDESSVVMEEPAADSIGEDHFAEARKSSPCYNRLTDDAECTRHVSDDKPKYFRIACLVAALEELVPSEDLSHQESVGYKLLIMRSEIESNVGVRDIVLKDMKSAVKKTVAEQKDRHQNSGRWKGSGASALSKAKRTSDAPSKKVPKKKSASAKKPGKYRYYCQFPNCYYRDNDYSHFERIPKFPAELPEDASNARRKTNAKKRRRRRLWLEHCKIDQKHSGIIYICKDHPRYTVCKTASFEAKNGEKITFTATFDNVPMPIGSNSVRLDAEGSSFGLGSDRQKRKAVEKAKKAKIEGIAGELQRIKGLSDAAKDRVMELVAPVAKDAASWMMSAQNRSELAENDDVSDINSSVRHAAGLSVHVKGGTPQKRPLSEVPMSNQRSASPPETSKKQRAARMPPVVEIGSVSNTVVKNRTGFNSVLGMLTYVSIACDGDANLMMKTITSLTWFEEWFLFFEAEWERAETTWALKEDRYGLHSDRLKAVFDAKNKIVLKARARWPMFVTVEEDIKLRRDKYSVRYKNKQVVFWDMTNVSLPKPTDADMQRLTWSQYYFGNEGKGGVGVQPCGWMATYPLWTGAISDTDYLNNAGILEMQKEYATKFATECNSEENPFVNIVDKGFRSIVAALRAGKQLLLQPFFAKSDQKFNTHQVLTSAAIAADRAGNERAVDVAKRAGMLKRGVRPRESLDRICDVWLGWSFQANFMYKPVM